MTQIRKHLIGYLENRDAVVFPDSTMKPVRSKRRIKSEHAVLMYCKCSLPWYKGLKLGSMAQCKECKQWYHQNCANIPLIVFSDSSTKWICDACCTSSTRPKQTPARVTPVLLQHPPSSSLHMIHHFHCPGTRFKSRWRQP